MAAPASQSAAGYRGYKLLSVKAETPDQVQLLNHYAEVDETLDFWTHPRLGSYADVMVPPSSFAPLVRSWTQAGLNVTVKQNDVQAMIEEVEVQNQAYKLLMTATPYTSLNHNQYYTYNQVVAHLQTLANNFPSLTKFDSSGKNPDRPRTEGGKIIHFIEAGAQMGQKPVIMLEVNIHAREHITAAAMLYTLDWLLTNYATQANAKAILDNYHLVVVPVANPDGYDYSHQSSSTVSPNSLNFAEPNFATSSSCSSDTYPGPYASSEAETQAIEKIFEAFKARMAIYLPVHCYSQVLLTPYSSSSTGSMPCNGAQHTTGGRLMADAIKAVDGRTFGVGSAYSQIGYSAKGTSGDWALYAKPGVVSIAYELRPSSNTSNGFVLSASEIVTAGKELLNSLVAIANYVRGLTTNPCASG
ncbi:hypothetical protein C0Q70_15745 [Pomacea canaliculata]|uniref:Peptidase M14 domain-containing protein n=1 Tax=Pomacea canaliculata TaxID=400727 RepID=A0A2T7NVQ5_POMCA|nr:hypothetical protein C0Q70_15745 [Pomacea canaliculata]